VTDRDFAAWRDRQSDADPELPIAGGDVCVQVYTSGTTGRPKGAQLTNDNLRTLLARLNSGKWREWSTVDVSLVAMPLFHVAGSVYGLCGLYVGARNVLLREVVPQQILEVIDRYRVSKIAASKRQGSALGSILRLWKSDVRAQGNSLPPRQVGEIICRSAQVS
jgi:acyl-CoA synthetase (AMP-forming)/AMP-acid ligase II